jgi:hypothetical protein
MQNGHQKYITIELALPSNLHMKFNHVFNHIFIEKFCHQNVAKKAKTWKSVFSDFIKNFII